MNIGSRQKAFIFLSGAIAVWAISLSIYAQSVPDARILQEHEVLQLLQPDIAPLAEIYRLRDAGQNDEAIEMLATYLKEKIAGRYFFDWRNFPDRFSAYQQQYPDQQTTHAWFADAHVKRYAPETVWQLPFVNRLGDSVTAYELRHLARQQKSADMAMMYAYENNNSFYRDYFVRQVADLNRAFVEGAYDDAGNGIYERFRAGKRVQNWLFCHHVYLASEQYDWRQQMLLVRTMLHHGAQLAKRTRKFSYGNHHTRGLVALFEIATLFPEFSGVAEWREQALSGLVMHLEKEVNEDGFQFERSVHYHLGDIENYFRVYQLAGLNNIPLPDLYRVKFRKMFESLAAIAQPNRRAPVLQDDTDRPYAESNEIEDAMRLGALIFNDPGINYFAGEHLPASIYWLLSDEQAQNVESLRRELPTLGSLALPHTGYYVMRNGWELQSEYMVLSAGLSANKPDHQHGEMLSIAAFANGNEILPNYQVNYNIPDLKYWKNAWTKNVALVDSIPLGRGWRQNSGRSGFGKWRRLPRPGIIAWQTGDEIDFFAGTHDSYDSVSVSYAREVLFFKEGFWLVLDHFDAPAAHDYQQIWQGHYTVQKPGEWLRSSFANGTGLDIVQLAPAELSTVNGGRDGKQSTMFIRHGATAYTFITLLAPFESYLTAVRTDDAGLAVAGRQIHFNQKQKDGDRPGRIGDAALMVHGGDRSRVLIDATAFAVGKLQMTADPPANIMISDNGKEPVIMMLGIHPVTLRFSKTAVVRENQNRLPGKRQHITLKPGDVITLE